MSCRIFGLGAGLVGALVIAACAGKQDAAGQGEDCYRDEDCRVGLVCVANASGTRVCTADVSSLTSTVPAPPPPEDAGTPPDAADDGGTPADAGDDAAP